jgi:prophage regulatory protein
MVINLLRLPPTLKKRGKSKTAHYLDIYEGLFTKPVQIGARAVAWPEHEIDALNAARIAGMCDDEIRELVIELEANRKTLLNMVRAQ